MNANTITVSDAKLEEVRKSLAEWSQQWKPTAHGKLYALKPLKAEIIALKRKKIANAEIAHFLTTAGIPVSADTVRRFLIECGFGKSRSRSTRKPLSGQMTHPGPCLPPIRSAAIAPSGFKTIKDDEL